jgi:hypothetical protein
MKYLVDNGTFTENLIFTQDSGHNTDLTREYMSEMLESHPEIKFSLLTNYQFPSFPNLEIL